jgi:predicted HAD superfamily Cof-like phosphohydrolase
MTEPESEVHSAYHRHARHEATPADLIAMATHEADRAMRSLPPHCLPTKGGLPHNPDHANACAHRCWSFLKELAFVQARPTSALRAQLIEFHTAVGQPVVTGPKVPSEGRVRLRCRLIAEEFFETLEAMIPFDGDPELKRARERIMAACDVAPVEIDFVELADGLGDLDYVVEGTRLEFGIDGGPIAAEIHRSNIAKSKGDKRADGKILKPKDWTPPDIRGELLAQGWRAP